MFHLTVWRCFFHVLALALFLIGHGPAHTFADEAAAKRVLGPLAKGLKVGPKMDASGRILRRCVFVGLDLRGANFDGADLGGCEIYQCDLRGASFKAAVLTGLLWGDCELEGADFTDAVINGYKHVYSVPDGIRFTEEQFVSTWNYKTKRLRDCIIAIKSKSRDSWAKPRFDFRNAQLNGALFCSPDLSECDFTDASIGGMGVNGGIIPFEKIASTQSYARRNLRGVGFGGITVTDRWDLSGVDLTGASFVGHGVLADADLTNANISECDFRCSVTKEQLFSTRNYREGRLLNLQIYYRNFSGADFSGMNLTGCRFGSADFAGASFEDAVITDVDFCHSPLHPCKNLTPAQIKSTWNYKHGRMAGIRLPEKLAKALKEEEEKRKETPAEVDVEAEE